jgi:hypothetical protein
VTAATIGRAAAALAIAGAALAVSCGEGRRSEEAQGPPPTATPAPAAEPAGAVIDLRGHIVARRAADKVERVLRRGAPLYADDAITTGEEGIVELVLTRNGARMLMSRADARTLADTAAWAATTERARQVVFVDQNNKTEVDSLPLPVPIPATEPAFDSRSP